jgi:glycosyltransferase involved in cell wall biosynthesis
LKVLHILSQRPLLTGSGVTLAELCRQASAADFEQHVVCGIPGDAATKDDPVNLPGVPADHVHPVRFGEPPLDFDVPGMSDVMPYASTRWRDMNDEQLDAYRRTWRSHLAQVVDRIRPDIVHSHHLWLVSAIAREVVTEARFVVHSHATGLRQIQLCPHLADEVCAAVSRADAILALHAGHARQIVDLLDVPPGRLHVVGAGYASDVFHGRGRTGDAPPAIVYAGKLAVAKGVPWLLDAFEQVLASQPDARLHLAGGAGGPGSVEGAAIEARARAAHRVTVHGALPPADLAALLRRCRLLVLPSMYEGLPLVLAEARACGCRLVATGLAGVKSELAPAFGEALELVAPPRVRRADEPVPEDLPGFVASLAAALERALAAPAWPPTDRELAGFQWPAVFARVERAWRDPAFGEKSPKHEA